MPFRIRIRDFQSIEDATIDVDGLTVITGPNNSGKTAVHRAVFGAFTNTRGTKFVRRGKDTAKVDLTFSDGPTLHWEKGEKSNRYEVDGKALNKVGQGAPPEIASLFGVMPVEAAGRELWPQFAHQFVGQVFLLDEPGSVLAEAVANVDRVGVLNESLRLSQSDRRTASSELKVRLEDVAKQEAALLAFDGLDDAVARVRILEDEHRALKGEQKRLEDLKSLRAKLSTSEEIVDALRPIRDVPRVEDTLVERTKKILSALEWARNAAMRQEKAVHEYESAHESWQAWEATALELPDIQGIRDAFAELESVRVLDRKIKAARDAVQALRGTIHALDVEYQTSAEEVDAILKETGYCPFCGVRHEANGC